MATPYEVLTLRNAGYVTPEVQVRIAKTRLLIAGCGIGSTIAEAAARLGFTRFVLADGDVVDAHNLNRQAYGVADVGKAKTVALRERLRGINPEVEVVTVGPITRDNAEAVVSQADVVLDTIDFLALDGLVALHDAAHRLQRPAFSAVSAGFGAAAMYFPAGGTATFGQLFGVPEGVDPSTLSYTAVFGAFMQKLATVLDPLVVQVVARALTVMEDGRPCPASQVAPGAAAVAALATTMLVRVLSGQAVTAAPELVVVDFFKACQAPGLSVV